uniref:phenazine biosynthesis-like domain-containing protein isoform X2 n=1 Tax=Myxine glutinosa TaxID=7769 RepID=UPI00358F9A45
MRIPLFVVDAFSRRPFCGNPAAVCLLNTAMAEETYQSVAAEMNLSETAFVQTLSERDTLSTASRFSLRWFTPTQEVPLCGHATLATAAVLYSETANPNVHLTFETLSGELYARKKGENIVLDFPLNPPVPQGADEVKDLLKAAVGDLEVREVQYSSSTRKLLVCLSDSYTRQNLESLRVDAASLLAADSGVHVRGVIVTLRGDGRPYNFYSRYFAPWVGINEDPVTGSAHTVLAPYWSGRLGMMHLQGRQCSPRGGDVDVTIREDGRVDLAGHACIVTCGTLHF